MFSCCTLHAEAFTIMILNDYMPKDKANLFLRKQLLKMLFFQCPDPVAIRFLICLIMHIFHFPVNRISFTKYLFFSCESGRQIKTPLSITMLRVRWKPIYLFRICRSDSLLGHLFVCAACLPVQINLLLGRPASCCKLILQFQPPSPAIGPLIGI